MITEVPVMTNDMELVREFARHNSNEAFAALFSRHVNLVYSVAIRQVGEAHLAEEVTQAVFLILARKAGSLGTKTILSGWLCRTARNAAANALTIQRRRQRREQEAYVQSICNEPEPESESDAWKQIAPLLDTAMAQLGEKNHDAVVLRFFDGKDLKEVGAALGVSEEAAKKRVARAVEKLRLIFHKRGIVVPVSILVAAISANAVQAAPAGLATIATPVASGGTTLTLLKIMAMTKLKYGILAGLLVASVATTTVAIKLHSRVKPAPKSAALPSTNGYDFFVKAAQMLQGDSAVFRQLNPAGLRAFVGQNAGALEVARQGFEHESRVADNDSANRMDKLAKLKQLNSVLCAEGRLAEMESRKEDAIRSYLDDLRLGQESSRGGNLIFRLVGVAIETTALKSLQPLTNGADASQCKEIAQALEELDAKEPPGAEALQAEQASVEHEVALRGIPMTAEEAKLMEPSRQKAAEKFQAGQLLLRQTMVAFAARAYELEKQHHPTSLADLTPDYLKAIPQDPANGKDMVYPR